MQCFALALELPQTQRLKTQTTSASIASLMHELCAQMLTRRMLIAIKINANEATRSKMISKHDRQVALASMRSNKKNTIESTVFP